MIFHRCVHDLGLPNAPQAAMQAIPFFGQFLAGTGMAPGPAPTIAPNQNGSQFRQAFRQNNTDHAKVSSKDRIQIKTKGQAKVKVKAKPRQTDII